MFCTLLDIFSEIYKVSMLLQEQLAVFGGNYKIQTYKWKLEFFKRLVSTTMGSTISQALKNIVFFF